MSGNGAKGAALGLIFDLDGVIVHSTPLHTRAWEVYLSGYGISPEGVQSRMHGLRNDDIVRSYFGGDLEQSQVLAHGAAKEELFRRMMAPELEEWLVGGLREFLERHREQPMGLASNAERPNIDLVLDGAGLRRHFRAVVDGHQTERPKPFPDIYHKAAASLGLSASECVVFEDSLAGVEAALRAGARVVGVATTLEELPGVDLMIPDFRDARLEPWLSGQASRR